MENLELRFKQTGGAYKHIEINNKQQDGGGKELTPKSQNWKKQYLLMKSERDNLQNENNKLKKKIKKLENNK